MILKAEPMGVAGETPFIFLHGFLGSGENWKGIARRFKDRYLTLCPDARNHGGSPHADEMSYPFMAEDLIDTANGMDLGEVILLGHSMGGKTAMEAALSHPRRVKALIIVDIAPKGFPARYTREIEALKELDVAHLSTRQEAMEALAAAIPDRTMRGFFLKNLVRTGDSSFRWRINMPGILANYSHIWEGIEQGRSYDGPVLFIRGGESNYIEEAKDSDMILSLFPRAEIRTVDGAGHWVHVDRPAELIRDIEGFLSGIRE